MSYLRCFLVILAMVLTPWPMISQAQETTAPPVDRSATGGAQTLEDILARQRGQEIDDSFRRDATGSADNAAGIANQLGTLGGASDSEMYRAIRYGSADVTVSNNGPASNVLIQDGGMWWLEFRRGPLATYGAWLLGGTLVVLALFYLIRGRIRIEGRKTGRKLLRFTGFERFGHWLFAGSFLLLALTGLISLFGRMVLIPAFGHQAFSTLAIASKWVHNNVAWAFMLGLVIVTVNWIWHNLPDKTDLKWLAQGGGLFSKHTHPPAKKFNAGQKLIFWACIVLGLSISASGLSLLFPFQLPMFASTFAHLNDWGLPQLVGLGPLPDQMAPHEEMQYSQLWHSIVAFVFIAIIFAHIYLGTLGMEGAFDAMGTGRVEEQWAREHHSLWVDEVKSRETRKGAATPAE
ncbi:formate dehydrogenase subunit gamma [Phaeobacter sp. 22II1-1F12B]|uniref:formate dehydrogenase subunit gamma n=1 Tax=Phaeobacter sp. 22II1-1F12B TaxID=1317111 RepID=UPI000B52790A|nr:formate dehydrogenase [Phaeobacter sp. 22II1-1F12B]